MLEEVLVLSLSRQTLEANAKQTNKNYKMITANQIKQVKKPEKEKKKKPDSVVNSSVGANGL